MADPIEQLNFKVILNDADFRTAVNNDLALAKKLKTSLSSVLKISGTRKIISDAGVKNAREMSMYLDEIARKINSMPKGSYIVGDADALNKTLAQVSSQLDKIINKQNQHKGAIGATNSQLLTTTSIMRTLAQLTGITFSLVGVRRFLSSLIEITGQFEVQKMALRNMLQDVAAADRIFRQLYEFSSESTYRFSELAKYSKQLAAFNIGKDSLLETTKMLGDVASGVGVSMDRLILAYGHVKSSGFLRGIQLRSFSQNGVPILDELAKMFTEIEGKAVSLGEVFNKMMKREIPFEMVEEAFKRMTSEGGKFYKMQEVLSKTLAGQINILKGKWENAMYAIGESQDKTLKGSVKFLTAIVNHLEEIGRVLKPVILGFGAYGVALAAASMGEWIVGASRAVKYFILLAQRTNIATAAVRVFGTTTKAAAVGLGALTAGVVIIAGLIKATGAANREMAEFRKNLDDIHQTAMESNAVDKEVSEIESLYKILNNTNGAYDARKEALQRLKEIVPAYHADLTEEGRLINNNKAALDKYIDALNREAKMKGAKDELAALYKLRREVQKEVDDAQKNVDNISPNAPISTQAATTYGYAFTAVSMSSAKWNTQLQMTSTKLQEIDNQIDSVNKEIEATMGITDDTVENYDVKSIVEGIQNIDKKIDNIRKKARKGSISAAEKEQLEALKSDREELAKEYEDILGIKYDKDTKNREKHETAAQQLANKERARITKEISTLEKYKNAYETLEPFLGEDTAKRLNAFEFYKDVDFSTLDTQITKLLDDLKKLGPEGEEAAESIAARLGLDVVGQLKKEYTEAQKALKQYEKAFEKFNKDWGEGNTGVAGKIEKAIRDYHNELKKIEDDYDDYIKAQAKVGATHGKSAEEIEKETKELEELYKARKKANDAKLQDTLVGLADEIFKDAMQGFDLTNWNDKNLSQILAIKKALETIVVPQKYKDMILELENGEEILALVEKEVAAIVDKTMQNTITPETIKKIVDGAKKVATYIGKAGDAMERLGRATNRLDLSDAGSALKAISQNLNAAAEGYAAAQSMGAGAYSWIGAVIGGVGDIFSQIVDSVGAANEKLKQMEGTIRDIRIEVQSARFDDLLSGGVDSMFGENFVRGIKNAADGLSELKNSLSEIEQARRSFFEWMLQENGTVSRSRNKRGPHRYYSDEEMAERLSQYATPDVGDMNIRTDHSFWKGDTFKTINEIAKEFNLELLDINKNLNPELLKKILDTYGDLNEGAKDWLRGGIEYAEEYDKALEQINDATRDIFDNLASDMADKFIDNFLSMGNAVDDLSDTFADLGDTILRSFLQSYILDEILSKYQEQATNALKKYSTGEMTPDDYANWLEGFANDVQRESEVLAPAINGMIEALKDRGLMNIDESTGNSLGSGIKSITEDTANLLASYINAIRADVSSIRVMQEKGWENINLLGTSVPTLNEHLAQIAATNANIAQSNQAILSELQSVIGAPGTSGMVVRTEAY